MNHRAFTMLALLPVFSACGGGGGDGVQAPPPQSFTLGGSISGLAGSGLVLQDGVGHTFTAGSNGSFAFTTPLPSGTSYAVVVVTQPSNPLQSCTVSGGAGTLGTGNVTSIAVQCATPPPNPPNVTAWATTVYTNEIVNLSAVSVDPNGYAISYLWDFGDGSQSTSNPGRHAYTSPGTYLTSVMASNDHSAASSSGQQSITVLSPSDAPSHDNTFEPYCTGPFCAAVDAGTYGGPGFGVWHYHNSTTQPATIDINIKGVSEGQLVSLVFTNGLNIPIATLPVSAAQPAVVSSKVGLQRATLEQALAQQNLLNAQLTAEATRRSASQKGVTATAPAVASQPATAIGDTRNWFSAFDGLTHSIVAQQACALPGGRSAVFWTDPALLTDKKMTSADFSAFAGIYCGDGGAYALLVGLMGDAWGPAAASHAELIQDPAGAPLEINVVFLPAAGQSVGGFFSSGDTQALGDNRALAVVINGDFIDQPGALGVYETILIHETAHLINYYQRSVTHGYYHDAWLEEGSAMMAEDIVTTAVMPAFDQTSARVGSAEFAGGVSMLDWAVDGKHYGISGSLGAFLTRRYGLSIFTGLISECQDGFAGKTSYDCLDQMIRQRGGLGIADEFSRMGTTLYAGFMPYGRPWGFGFPATRAGTFDLFMEGTDFFPAAAPTMVAPATFGAMSNIFQNYWVPAGQTTYTRTGVVVPEGAILMVVVRDLPK